MRHISKTFVLIFSMDAIWTVSAHRIITVYWIINPYPCISFRTLQPKTKKSLSLSIRPAWGHSVTYWLLLIYMGFWGFLDSYLRRCLRPSFACSLGLFGLVSCWLTILCHRLLIFTPRCLSFCGFSGCCRIAVGSIWWTAISPHWRIACYGNWSATFQRFS